MQPCTFSFNFLNNAFQTRRRIQINTYKCRYRLGDDILVEYNMYSYFWRGWPIVPRNSSTVVISEQLGCTTDSQMIKATIILTNWMCVFYLVDHMIGFQRTVIWFIEFRVWTWYFCLSDDWSGPIYQSPFSSVVTRRWIDLEAKRPRRTAQPNRCSGKTLQAAINSLQL